MEENVERLGPALLKAFMKVPDPRSPSGKRHPLPAILTLATGAMLCNCHSLYAIFQWGREHEELALKLGFKGAKPQLYLPYVRYSDGSTKQLLRPC
jgi:hypothetical protein